MADLKITDDKLEKILYSSMSPDVRETELKFHLSNMDENFGAISEVWITLKDK